MENSERENRRRSFVIDGGMLLMAAVADQEGD
jgi:hypothetical protein